MAKKKLSQELDITCELRLTDETRTLTKKQKKALEQRLITAMAAEALKYSREQEDFTDFNLEVEKGSYWKE